MPIGPDESVRGILVYWVTKQDRVLHADPCCAVLGKADIGQVEPWAVWKLEDADYKIICKECN